MNRLDWWLIDILSRMLEAEEREAVCGDLVECGESGSQALRDLFGLVLRRQAALWTDWRVCTALVCVVIPLGMLLSLISVRMADSSAIYMWLYANNWDSSLLANTGFRHDFLNNAAVFLLQYVALACWAWSSGYVLGSVSRRTVLLSGLLFSLTLLCGELVGVPRYLGLWISLHRARDLHNNAAVFVLTFYRIVFPLIVRIVLVLIPAFWGMRQALQAATIRPLLRRLLWTAAIGTLIVMWRFPEPYRRPEARDTLPLQLFVYWPLGYLAVSAIMHRGHRALAAT